MSIQHISCWNASDTSVRECGIDSTVNISDVCFFFGPPVLLYAELISGCHSYSG